jgi:hypothetical protein
VLSPTASAYGLEGILHVATQATEGISSKLYDVRGDLYRVETLQQPDKVTNLLTGELKVGNGSDSFEGNFDYKVTNGSLAITPRGADLILLGERNSTEGAQQQSSNLTALPSQQPANMTILQQPMIQQTPSPSLQQLTTTSLMTSQAIPQQQIFPSSPLTSATPTVQPQASYYPPSSATFKPTLYPSLGTAFPPTIYPPVGTSNIGYPMIVGSGIGSASPVSQIISS